MFKKIGIAAVVVGAGLFVLNATGLSSYTSTAFTKVRQNFKHQVPLEFEIERVRHEVAKLVPDMRKNFSVIAEEMVAVETLQKDVSSLRAALVQQKDNILTMTKDLENGSQYITYDGRRFSAERVRDKLTRDYASYQNSEAELKSKEQLLDAKERSLEAAKEQMASMKAQKQELEIQIAQLEADLKTIRLTQTRNKVHVDDSQLARCKKTLSDIRTRLSVERKTSELEGTYSNDHIPVEKKAKPTNELIEEIRTHLGGDVSKDAKVVDKN